MRKTFFLYFLAVTVLLPWACSDNNAPSNPSSPALGGGATPTVTGTIPTATFSPTPTPTGVAPLTATPTWTFVAPKPYLNNYRTSAAPNGMYYDAPSQVLVVAEASNQSGTIINAIEEYGVPSGLGSSLALPPGVGNGYIQGQATPTAIVPPVPTVVPLNITGTFNFPVGAVSSNGSIATLDSPPGGPATLWAEDNNYYWPAAGPGGPFMNWTNGFGGATFHNPKCLTADSTGELYVADTGNGYIDWFGPGNGVLGSSPAWYGRWNGPGSGFGPGVNFKVPIAVACDNSRNVYVADSGPFAGSGGNTSMVQVYSSGGTTILGSFTLIPNCVVNGITADSAGDFFVTDTFNGQVEEYQMMPYPFVAGSPSTQVGLVTAWGDPHSYHEFNPYTPSCLQFIGSYVIVGDQANPFLNIFGP